MIKSILNMKSEKKEKEINAKKNMTKAKDFKISKNIIDLKKEE